MRKINPKKVQIVYMVDSTTSRTTTATYSGEMQRFWVKHNNFKIEELYLLDTDEPDPEAEVGFAWGKGFIDGRI